MDELECGIVRLRKGAGQTMLGHGYINLNPQRVSLLSLFASFNNPSFLVLQPLDLRFPLDAQHSDGSLSIST